MALTSFTIDIQRIFGYHFVIILLMKQLTKEAHEKLKATRADMETRRVEIARIIEHAKELGDLSENTEYITARQDLNFLLGEIDRVEAVLRDCEIVAKKDSKNCVSLGSTVEVSLAGKPQTFVVVSFNEADPSTGKISNESPIGSALMNTCEGDAIDIETPTGKTSCKVKKIS